MKWWKAHHGIATDLKYAVLLRWINGVTERNALRVTDNEAIPRCHPKRADILAVWVWLIDFSSQNHPRGSFTGASVDEIATSLDLEDSAVDLILEAFRWRGMITGNVLTAFEKRQPHNDPTGAERQRRYRERKRERNALRGVTPLRNENSLSQDRDVEGREVLVVNDHVPDTETERVHTGETLNGTGIEGKPDGKQRVRPPSSIPTSKVAPVANGAVNGHANGKTNGVVAMGQFDAWWEIWSPARGTHHKQQAVQAWLSVVIGTNAEAACFECTRSYVASLNDPSHGYNPHTFLFEHAKDEFKGRWPRAGKANGKREGFSDGVKRRAAERISKGQPPI